MKAFTDILQSKKLAEFLPLESADMTYCAITEGMREKMIIKNWEVNVGLDIAIKENLFSYRNGYMVPCWSLAALLGLMPRIEHLKPFIDLSPKLDSEEVAIYYHSEDSPYIVRDNPVDACVAMIEKLHEQKLL